MVSYEVSVQRADVGGYLPVAKDGIESTAFELTGLVPATRYVVRVRARSSKGYGPMSEDLTVTTAGANRVPGAPLGTPKAQASSNRECTTLTLHLPELRPGCGGDEELIVEMSDGSSWLPAAEGVKGKTATITALDPYVAYRYRMIAKSSVGTSSAGTESPPLLTDNEHSKDHPRVGDPPSVSATSSASYLVSWASSSCRPQLTWELLYAHQAVHGETWQTIASGIAGSSYEVQSLRCPSGCAFRVRPLELRNLDDPYSKPSAVVRTKPLPRIPAGAVRIELKLSTPVQTADQPGTDLHGDVVADLATALGVGRSRISVVEARGRGLFLIFDILPGDVGPTPMELANELEEQVGKADSQLYAGMITKGTDSSAPLLLVSANGTVSRVRQEDDAGDDVMELAGTITSAMVVLGVLCGVVMCAARVLRSRPEGRGGAQRTPRNKAHRKKGPDSKKTYSRIDSMRDDDDDWDDDDDDDDIIEREARRLS